MMRRIPPVWKSSLRVQVGQRIRTCVLAVISLSLLGSCGSGNQARSASGTGDGPGTAGVQVASATDAFSNPSEIAATMNLLASDELQGRETGSEGIEQAAVFLEGRLKDHGISPYFQSYRDTLSNSRDVAYNIVGVLEGSDPKLKKEFLVIGAHYDHIGVVPEKDGDGIANGANDNASGTATVLELARYFGSHGPPRRSIIFAFFSAEEKGLLGSKHLAGVLKEQGLDLYAMLNFEMTGGPLEDKGYLTYLTGFRRSNLAEVCNAYGGADLVGFLPAAGEYNLFERSDNYAFFEEFGVPAHTFSTFDFENYDYYHQPGDEVSRLDLDHMASLVNRMIPAIQGIANRAERQITAK